MKKCLKGLMTLTFVFALAAILVLPSQAATRKVKNQDFTSTISTVKKKAVTAKKGTQTVKLLGSGGFLKFKAPKTKTYTFTGYGVKKPSGEYSSYGYFYLMTVSGSGSYKYLKINNVKTKGGKNTALYINSNKNSTSGKKATRSLKSRSGSIKLKKGQTVYIYSWFTSKKTSYKLKIK